MFVLMCVLSMFYVASSWANLAETKIAFTSQRDGVAEVYVMDYDGTNQRRVSNFPEVSIHPTWSPDGSRVAFAQGDSFRDIFTMHADGSNVVNLTNDGSAAQGNPHISPDGTKIAYTSGSTPSDIIVADISGANPVNLTSSSFRNNYPRWSPDGTKIVFTSNRDGLWQVYVMDAADGANQTNLSNSGVDDHEPGFSPDGTKIVFASTRDGDADIFVMDSTGANQASITVNAFANWSPSWSPDGTRIVYYGVPAGNGVIYASDPDGANEVQLTTGADNDSNPNWMPFPFLLEGADGVDAGTVDVGMPGTATFTVKNQDAVSALSVSGITSDNALFTAAPTTFNLAAGLTQVVTVTYSPVATGADSTTITVTHDGPMGSSVIGATGTAVIPPGNLTETSIVFQSARDGNVELYAMDYDGANQRRLTDFAELDRHPAWSPDGSRIVWARGDTSYDIYMMYADGTHIVNLTNDAGTPQSFPQISPDGTTIAFHAEGAFADVWTMNIDGSSPTNLTNIAGTHDSWARWTPDGQKLLFVSQRDGHPQIYVMDANGANPLNLSNNAVNDQDPVPSPDGAKILFVSDEDGDTDVYVMDISGANRVKLTANSVSDGTAVWSADGSRIIFDRNTTGTWDLFSMAADGTDEVQVTTAAGDDKAAHWSPFPIVLEAADGIAVQSEASSSGTTTLTVKNQAAGTLNVSGITSDNGLFSALPTTFSLLPRQTQTVTVTYSPTAIGSDAATLTVNHNGPMGSSVLAAAGTSVITPRSGDLTATKILFYRGDGDIMTVDYDGTNEVSLTSTAERESEADWSPDGTKIAYDSDLNGLPGIFVSNADGTGVVQVTTGQVDNDSGPAWSPDGTVIAFKRKVTATNETDIYKMNADGTTIVRLTTDGLGNVNPSWSPDGASIVFQSQRDGGLSEIYVMDADGSGQTRLTNNAVQDILPRWSPDGSKIAFQEDVDGAGAQEILLMNPDGTGQTNITNNAVFDGDPSWSPDGTRIVFRSKLDSQATTDLYHMAADGTDVIRITTSGQADAHPSWGPFPSTATVTAVDTQGQVGRVATVPINITDVRGLDLTGVTITLTYDPAIITPQDDGASTTAVTRGAMVPVTWGLAQNVVSAGTLSFSMAGGFEDPITGVGGGVLATVAFDVSGTATVGATSALTITEANLNEGGVTSTIVSGTLTVVTLKYGDVTGNGDVTAFDASWVLEYVAKDMIGQTTTFPIETTAPTWGVAPLTQADAFSVADVDANAIVQSMDASLILQHDVDIITAFPADTPAAPSRAVSPDAYQLTASATSERPDACITVSLDAAGIDDLYAGELALEFDAEVVRPVTVYLERKSKGGKPPLLVHAEDEGRLGVAFASAKPIAARDATLNVVFEPLPSLDGPVDGAIRSSRLGLNATRLDPSFEYRFHIEPYRFQALANYPNPFNPETWIPFELNEDSDVTIHIYGLDGQRVRTLEIGSRAMGVHAVRDAAAYWDGRNELGEAVSSGLYVYELIAGSQRAMRRMVVLK
ncbi:choice-of-anchor D domain-containing protein [Candidatus Poribacteria bacterium]|nr:choice-of-anchor D domain-containing protein [Candidatus Poribacteria bacterium]